MALVNCHECGAKVSTEAAACPGCGAKPKPEAVAAAGKKHLSGKEVVGGLALAAGLVWFMASGNSSPAPAEDQAAKEQKEAACKQDLKCWGERGTSAAHVMCKQKVEALAKHSVKWTDEGMFEQKFSRYRWKDQGAGIVTYFGDKAQFQNGFGAYTNVIYSCDVDVAGNKAISATLVSEGRLPES